MNEELKIACNACKYNPGCVVASESEDAEHCSSFEPNDCDSCIRQPRCLRDPGVCGVYDTKGNPVVAHTPSRPERAYEAHKPMLQGLAHSKCEELLAFFRYEHLPKKLQLISKPIGDVAFRMRHLPANEEKLAGLESC